MAMTENATDATSEVKTEEQKTGNQNPGNQNPGTQQKFSDVIPEAQPVTQSQSGAQAEAKAEASASQPTKAADRSANATAVVETMTGLHEECERLRAERDGLVDRLARLQAEFDNARKREQRERADYRAFAVADAVEQFLPVLDNFRLALNSNGTAEQLRTGVELIAKQMDEVLRALNVTPVETVGHPFDPRVHEALESVERTDLPDHQVIDEVRRGYRIKDRLLRPALVRISVNPNLSQA
ncbi:MAG TPA: nucleotide exchange factor GrpE [Acidobacteriaceae bacterium]|nr:nucleotide exchange factor GrpE [Acidobacteriaceae bacterium]